MGNFRRMPELQKQYGNPRTPFLSSWFGKFAIAEVFERTGGSPSTLRISTKTLVFYEVVFLCFSVNHDVQTASSTDYTDQFYNVVELDETDVPPNDS